MHENPNSETPEMIHPKWACRSGIKFVVVADKYLRSWDILVRVCRIQ